jgi:hypothetical protein
MWFAIVTCRSPWPVVDAEVFQDELAFAIMKRSAAAETEHRVVVSWRRFDADDFVFRSADGAMEARRVRHAANYSPNVHSGQRRFQIGNSASAKRPISTLITSS